MTRILAALAKWRDARKAAIENCTPETFTALADAEAELLACDEAMEMEPWA